MCMRVDFYCHQSGTHIAFVIRNEEDVAVLKTI